MYILLCLLAFYMLFYKFAYIDSCIYLELRKLHSKSFLKKNKPKNIFDKVFYIRYKKEINKYLYIGKILFFIAGIFGYLILIISLILSNEYLAENYVVFLVVLSVFSIFIWITTSMLYKVNTYSLIQKILYVVLYITVILYWLVKLIISVVGFFTNN